MSIFLSASEHYKGRKKNKSILEHLKDKYNGYTSVNLNLADFISVLDLNMTLNNELISSSYEDWEVYNFSDLLYDEEESLKEDIEEDLINLSNNNEEFFNYLDNIADIDEVKELLKEKDIEDIIDTFQDDIYDLSVDAICSLEVYQYFIVPEYEAINYWNEYTNYPIYYNEELDLYLIGITHWGMSWKYFNTTYEYRSYL